MISSISGNLLNSTYTFSYIRSKKFAFCKYNTRKLQIMACKVENSKKLLAEEDLAAYISSGCKDRSRWRIGTEHEKLGYYVDSHKRIDHATIQTILSSLIEEENWKPIKESSYIIGAEKDGQSVTIEPGGQFELSGAPLSNLHETLQETEAHLNSVKKYASKLGVAFLTLGFDPKWQVADVPIMPKNRYRIMRNYMPKVGTLGHDMMFRSTTIQVNLDFENEQDLIEKVRIGLALQPVATALFANSPFRNGEFTGFQSWRSNVWTDVDADRCGILPFVWDDDFGINKYTQYALDVPMYFVYRNHEYLDMTQQRVTFRDFLHGKNPLLPGEYPTIDDWESHLTTIFPEVRLKKYLEMRGADSGPLENIIAVSSFWVGLLYNKECQDQIYKKIMKWTLKDHEYLRREIPRNGLETEFQGGTLLDLAKEMIALSIKGLKERGLGEEIYLKPLERIVQTGMTGAKVLIEKYHNEWNKKVDSVYSPEFNY